MAFQICKAANTWVIYAKRTGIMQLIGRNKYKITLGNRVEYSFGYEYSFRIFTNAYFIPVVIVKLGKILFILKKMKRTYNEGGTI